MNFQQLITYNFWEIFTCYACSANGGREVEDTQVIGPRRLTTVVLEITAMTEEMESDLLSYYQKMEKNLVSHFKLLWKTDRQR